MKAHAALFLIALITLALYVSSAHAKNDKHGNGKGGPHHESEYRGHDDRAIIVIDNDEREVIHRYMEDRYRRNCPPGLAKKHNGCMPPGQARKYRVGYPLPPDVVFVPVADDLLVHLPPLPSGYRFVQVDQDILLIGEATKKVIDAVTLLSAVGN